MSVPRDSNGAYHILAARSVRDERTRVLKHGDTFAVFDHYGDIRPGGLGEEGLYHEGTRYLSCFILELEKARPFFLSSTVRNENDQLAVALTNPDVLQEGSPRLPLGTLHLALKKFLWQAACHQQLRIKNYALQPVEITVSLHVEADFADIFEVRGMKRKAHGRPLPAEQTGDCLTLGYRGLDDVVRRTIVKFDPPPTSLTASTARFHLSLKPQEEAVLSAAIHCQRGAASGKGDSPHLCEAPDGPFRQMGSVPFSVPAIGFDEARCEAQAARQRYSAWSCHVQTTNGQINAWINRAVADIHMMTTELPTGPYPYAGVPWFNTPFGRDGIVAALESLWLRPELARGVLAYLASTQAKEIIAEQDAEPGKILHETRNGEMAVLKEMPFGRYYGSGGCHAAVCSWPALTSGPATGRSLNPSGPTWRPR